MQVVKIGKTQVQSDVDLLSKYFCGLLDCFDCLVLIKQDSLGLKIPPPPPPGKERILDLGAHVQREEH